MGLPDKTCLARGRAVRGIERLCQVARTGSTSHIGLVQSKNWTSVEVSGGCHSQRSSVDSSVDLCQAVAVHGLRQAVKLSAHASAVCVN
jgi:hypothetical protein